MLAQQDVSAELIVVDDGSTDGTAELLARFAGRITVVSSEGRGVSAARNRGMALAQGELLVFLDADDLFPPHYLARFVEAAAGAPRAEVFHCGWRGIDFDDGRVLYGQDLPFDLDWDPFHALAAAGSPPISALAVRRRTATRVGPFDETESLQADWDYWLRLAASGATFQGVPGNVAIIRRRNDSMSASAGTQVAVAALPFSKGISRVTNVVLPALTRTRVSGVGDRLCSARRPETSRAGFTSRAGRDGWSARPWRSRCRPRLASTAWLALREKRRTA